MINGQNTFINSLFTNCGWQLNCAIISQFNIFRKWSSTRCMWCKFAYHSGEKITRNSNRTKEWLILCCNSIQPDSATRRDNQREECGMRDMTSWKHHTASNSKSTIYAVISSGKFMFLFRALKCIDKNIQMHGMTAPFRGLILRIWVSLFWMSDPRRRRGRRRRRSLVLLWRLPFSAALSNAHSDTFSAMKNRNVRNDCTRERFCGAASCSMYNCISCSADQNGGTRGRRRGKRQNH